MERAKHPIRRCAVYTRKSSEEGLEQDFNSLHGQRARNQVEMRFRVKKEGPRLRPLTFLSLEEIREE